MSLRPLEIYVLYTCPPFYPHKQGFCESSLIIHKGHEEEIKDVSNDGKSFPMPYDGLAPTFVQTSETGRRGENRSRGEMDITTGFEPVVGGSNPSGSIK